MINNGKEVWHYSSGDVIRSSAAVADDGTIYVGSYDKKLYKFTISSSTPIATFNLGATAKFSSPAVDKDGTVFFLPIKIICNKSGNNGSKMGSGL